jgi:(1->4)-alpha-D-glucan 1-alpha-D-glucosylmutase
VPDIYQGNELLHYALVDPDNREPVDYDVRKKAMGDLLQQQQSPESVSKLLELPNQHLAKLYLTWKTLTFRKVYPTLFQRGDYVSLAVSGQRASHVIAFARRREGRTVIVAVPRLCAKLLGDSHATICDAVLWGDTAIELPDFGAPCYHNVLTGECIPAGTSGEQHVPVANFFRHFPAALLVSEMFNSGASACV